MTATPDKMNFPAKLWADAKKLRSAKDRGEFLCAVMALFFDGEEVELSERPDLLMTGWDDRITKMREAVETGRGGAANKGTQGDTPKGTQGDTPKGAPEGAPKAPRKGTPEGANKGTQGDTPKGAPDENRDMSIEINTPPPQRAREARPPDAGEDMPSHTLDEVRAAFMNCGFGDKNPQVEKFFDHYSAQGWVFGNGQPVRDLNATVRRWMTDKPRWAGKGGGGIDGVTTIEILE